VDVTQDAIDDRSDNVQRVVFLGRLSREKGIPLLVEAFRKVVTDHPNTHLIIAGPDDQGIGRGMMRGGMLVGINDKVFFPGMVGGDQKRELLQSANIFVLPSAEESFGLAVAEAMAVGCPVVVTPGVALAKIVDEAKAGLVAERDPEPLRAAISWLLDHRDEASRMGARGRQVADARWAWPTIGSQAEGVYQSVVEFR